MRFPGNGSILASLLLTTKLKLRDLSNKDQEGTYDLLGKPNPYFHEIIHKDHNIPDKNRTIMIGDRPNTDIAFGKAVGVDTCLVMTGVVKDIEDFKENWVNLDPRNHTPTYFMNMFG